MIDGYKVIVVTPAGRKQFLQILSRYLLRDRDIVDEWHLWFNAPDKNDQAYISELTSQFPDFIKCIDNKRFPHESKHLVGPIGIFYRYCIDYDTIYIKCDDDIVFIDRDAIRKLVEYRIRHKKPFLVYANTLVNVIGNYLQQRMGNLTTEFGICTMHESCPVAWRGNDFALNVHHQFITKYDDGSLDDYKFNRFILLGYEKMSINFCCWFGEDLWSIGAESPTSDEETIGRIIPSKTARPNEVCGSSLVVHYGYMAHRKPLYSPWIVNRYDEISRQECPSTLRNENHSQETEV